MKISLMLAAASALYLLPSLLNCSAQSAGQTSEGIEVGQFFPDFRLPSMEDGKPVSLSSFRGKKVLLIQFASW